MLTGYVLRAKPLNEHTRPWYARLDVERRCVGLTHNPREALAFSRSVDALEFAARHLASDVTWEPVEAQVNRLQLPDEVDDYPITEADLDAVIALFNRPLPAPTLHWSEATP